MAFTPILSLEGEKIILKKVIKQRKVPHNSPIDLVLASCQFPHYTVNSYIYLWEIEIFTEI